jgi:putative nucleotidyltransferase with HDIG domain
MRSVEIAMRAYAGALNADVEKWGIVGLLHDFDYERWPVPPDHPLQGAKILAELGYPDDVIYAIKSHVGCLDECPRLSDLDRYLYACDELCGFITACALVRPLGILGMQAQSVQKKLKQRSFAEKVNRDDISQGAREIQVELGQHIQFVTDALAEHATELGLNPQAAAPTQ